MQTRIKPAYYLVLVVYAVLIGWLLYREFGETRAVNYSLGEIRISAGQSTGVPGPLFASGNGSFRSLELSYRSFVLEIPEAGGAALVYSDGREEPLTVTDIRRSSRNIVLLLGSGIELRIQESETEENSYLIAIDFSAVRDEALLGIRLPWHGREPELHGSLPILRASPAGSAGSLVVLPAGTRISQEHISLRRTNAAQTIYLSRDGTDDPLIQSWFARRGDLVSRAAAETALADWYDEAYRGWNGERWLADAGSWEYAADSPPEAFTATAMLLESLDRGSYFGVRERLAAGSPRLIDEISALFLGSVVTPFRDLASRSGRLVSTTKTRLTEEDPALFEELKSPILMLDSNLPGAAALRAPLEEAAETSILGNPATNEELLRAVNAARFLLLYSGSDNPGIRYLIREELMPRITALDSGYGIIVDGFSDSRLNTAAAGLMIESDDEFTASLGFTLLASLAAAAGEFGRIPAQIELQEFADVPSVRILEPEALPRLSPLTGDPDYRPRALNLGPGEGWIWTTAADIRYEAGTTASLSFSFPTGGVHHFALYNIAPFDELQMHGIPWKSDPEFQNYSDGWVYDPLRRALYVKIRHRASRQSIRIIRRSAAATTAPTEPALEPTTP